MAEAAESAPELTVEELFGKIDVNSNGQITKGEMFKAMTGSLKGEVEKKMGKNFLYHWKDYQNLDKATGGKDLTEEEKALASTTLDLKEFTIWVEDCKKNMLCAQVFKLQSDNNGGCSRRALVKDMHDRKDFYNKLFDCELVSDTWPNKEDAKEAAAAGGADDAKLQKKIDIAEFTQWIKERIDSLDKLSVEELFKKIDTNNNSQISKREMFKALHGDLKAEIEKKMGKNFLYHWRDFQALDKMDGKKELTEDEKVIADQTLDLKEFTIWVEDCRRNMICAKLFKEYAVVDGKERSAVDGVWNRSTLVKDMRDRKNQYNKEFGCELVTDEWPSKKDVSEAAASGEAENAKLQKKIDIAEYTEWIKERLNSLAK